MLRASKRGYDAIVSLLVEDAATMDPKNGNAQSQEARKNAVAGGHWAVVKVLDTHSGPIQPDRPEVIINSDWQKLWELMRENWSDLFSIRKWMTVIGLAALMVATEILKGKLHAPYGSEPGNRLVFWKLARNSTTVTSSAV